MTKQTEMDVLKVLVENPRLSDRKIADLVKTSQPTVTRQRNKLEKDQMIRYLGLPNFEQLGYEVIGFSISPEIEPKEDKRILFSGHTLKGQFIISIHKNITDFHHFCLLNQTGSIEVMPISSLLKDWDFNGIFKE